MLVDTTTVHPDPNKHRLLRLSTVCALVYVVIYSFESPIRYVCNLAHADSAIVLRDGLIVVPMLLLLARQAMQARIHPAFWLFFAVVVVNGSVSVLNFGTVAPLGMAVKMLLNVLFGLVAGGGLLLPDKRIARLFLFLWIASIIGVLLEKFVVTFPWVGIHATIGDLDVEISRDWQIQDSFSRRVGGFTKQSLSVAGLLPILGIVLMCEARALWWRGAICLATAAGVFLTTQKGALLGFTLVGIALFAPMRYRQWTLRSAVTFAVLLDIALPLYTNGLTVSQGQGGVYSASSFAMRIVTTWPQSLRWIADHEIFPFGLGLGGIGGAQRFIMTPAWRYPDNIFLLMYGFFGVPALLMFGWILRAVWRSARMLPEQATPALAVLAFVLFNGVVVSVIEDQMGALFLGASIGVLVNAVPRAPVAARTAPPTPRGYRANAAASTAS